MKNYLSHYDSLRFINVIMEQGHFIVISVHEKFPLNIFNDNREWIWLKAENPKKKKNKNNKKNKKFAGC